MDEIKLKDDLMARLARELERPVLQVIDGALSAVVDGIMMLVRGKRD